MYHCPCRPSTKPQDGGNRQFIMVATAEPTPMNSAARQLATPPSHEIGKERIRPSSANCIGKERANYPARRGASRCAEDLGFPRPQNSTVSFFEWQSDVQDVSQLGLRFVQAESPLVAKWEPQKHVTEILLLQGFPLDSTGHSARFHPKQPHSARAFRFATMTSLSAWIQKIHPDTIPICTA
jgi:hypothetical protein